MRRLLICAGGTGGGVYPPCQFSEDGDKVESVLWVGGEGGMEGTGAQNRRRFSFIHAAGVHGGLRRHRAISSAARGYSASKRILREYIRTRSFSSGCVAVPLAADAAGLPVTCRILNGLAIKAISRLASASP